MPISPARQHALQEIIKQLESRLDSTTDEPRAQCEAIVTDLAAAVGADHTFVGRILPDREHVETVVYCKGRNLRENFSYALEGTPCRALLDEGICLYQRDVAQQFPDDELLMNMMISGYVGQPLMDGNEPSGIVVALFMTPIREPEFMLKAFEEIAVRIGGVFCRLPEVT